MSGLRPSRALRAAACAAVLAASGVFRAGAGTLELTAESGLDYEAVTIFPRTNAVPESATLTLIATDPGTGRQAAEGLPIGTGSWEFGGVTAARSLVVDGYAVESDGVTTNAAAHRLFYTGHVHTNDNWMSETADTFTRGSGTGVWSSRDYVTVEDGRLRIDTTGEAEGSVLCSVGPVPTPRRGYEITMDASFPHPYEDLPNPAGQILGISVCGREDPKNANFYFLDNGGWTKVDSSVCDPFAATNWQIHVSVDCTLGVATYYLRSSSDRPWKIAGTATGIGTDSASEAEFRGLGTIGSLKGNGTDAQLLDVEVEFSAATLRPGLNFGETVVTGRVISTISHPTELTGGTFEVRLTGSDGSVITTKDYAFTSEGTMEFYISGADLTAGAAYRAEVIIRSDAEANVSTVVQTGVMGRALTNEQWGTTGEWVRENAKTFDGLEPGTGDWTGSASTTQEWISVATESETDSALSFHPTNVLSEAASGYVTSIRAIFPTATTDPGDTDSLFGFTLASTDDGLAFLCLSNGVWQVATASGVVPMLGTEYTLYVHVKTDKERIEYYIEDRAGKSSHLMTVEGIGEAGGVLFSRVDISGSGYVTDLTGSAYSTQLLRIHADFDEGTLYPGTNFTASTANGVIRFERLWETDRTNGNLRVLVRDKSGTVVGQRRITFHGISDRTFDYYIEGLEPGETYSVSVEADIKDVSSDSSSATGSMARTVTNGVWSTEGWIRENVETYAGRKTGSGKWDSGEGLAREEGDYIRVHTTALGASGAHVGFLATNELPSNTGFEIKSRLLFDEPRAELPSVHGDFGITIVNCGTDESPACRFAVLMNGVWTAVDGEVYTPDPSVEYEITVRVDRKKGEASYLARPSSSDAVPDLLASFQSEDAPGAVPCETAFYGYGRVRTHEGDGFDVSLVEIAVEADPTVPGTNFASTVASGVLRIRQIWTTDKTSGSYTIVVNDSHGNFITSRTLTYGELADQDFSVPVEGLKAGEAYDVVIVTDLKGEVVSTNRVLAVMARPFGGWIHETAATFAGEETGTGLWAETNGTAFAAETETGRAIRIDVDDDKPAISYDPTNDTSTVRNSTLREIRMDLDFGDVGWISSRPSPSVPPSTLAAVAVWGSEDDTDESGEDVALAVVTTNGAWTVLEETRRSSLLAGRCTVNMLIDLKAGFVRYELVSGSETNRVHQYDFDPTGPRKLRLGFMGSGYVHGVDGDVWDPNLIAGGTNEFADLDAAILGTETGTALSPLWEADQLVTVGKGTFKVDDPGKKLTVRFPWWYYVVVSTNGSVRIFKFNQSNNWIDYAEDGAANVETNGTLFLVKTPEGLSWIAARATNEWVSGRIELANDIDLSLHNWTPIAGFSGTFDGCGRRIDGLNNTNRNVGIPGGEYVCGPTNGWGRSTYGLFGTATNATLTGVTFADVAISNLADSVAALAGALAGNCAVSNVTVESGSVRGLGGTVAGIAGFADFAEFLTFVNNTNRAAVAAESAIYGEGRWAAGLLCVGGSSDPSAPGTLVVTNNANYAAITNAIYDADLLGGNVAQILAGATLGGLFGEVHLTNNLAAGAVEATLVRSPDNALVQTNFPAVNLAASFWGYDAFGTFYRHLDAGRPGALAVDPVRRTARMLSGMYANGTENAVGVINDEISALLPGATVTMTEGLDSWGPIVLDRDITFDLGGQTIYTVYINNTFVISNGVAATVRNGTIAVGPESEAFFGDTSHLTTNGLAVTDVPEDFYERTTLSVNGEPLSLLYPSVVAQAINRSGTVIELYDGADVEIDAEAGELKVNGVAIAQLTDCYGFSAVTDESGNVIGFEVKITDSSAPTAEFSMTGGEEGTVTVTVGNAKPGFWYALQHKDSLAADWVTPPADEWVRADANGASISAPTNGSQGYYRVLMSDVRGGGDE